MTKKELWLKLFSENDTALASAIHLCERFVTLESLENPSNKEFFDRKRAELYEDVDDKTVQSIFQNDNLRKKV